MTNGFVNRPAVYSAARSRVCFPPSMAPKSRTTRSRASFEGKTMRPERRVRLAPTVSKVHVAVKVAPRRSSASRSLPPPRRKTMRSSGTISRNFALLG